MREKVDYRDQLEQLNRAYPEGEMLKISEISKYTGIDIKIIRDVWKDELITIGKSKYMTKVRLAKLIS